MTKMKKLKAMFLALLAIGLCSSPIHAITLDFNDSRNLGVRLGGGMTWNQRGGGHLYNEFYDDDDQLFFAEPNTYLNSFEINALPWAGYRGGQVGLIAIEARNAAGATLWSQTLDLRLHASWTHWLKVDINLPNVAELYFHAPGAAPNFHGFWPSIDNVVINQPAFAASAPNAVPEGGMTIAIFGLALSALALLRRTL